MKYQLRHGGGTITLFRFYGISAFVGYLMPNPFLYKVLLQTIQFSVKTV